MHCKSCKFLEHGIYFKFFPDGSLSVKPCCNMDSAPTDEQIYLRDNYYSGEIDWNEILANMRKNRDNARKGILNPHCEKCWELKEHDWDEEDYFSEITLAPVSRCNCRCTYCFIGNHEELYNSKQEHDLLPILEDLQNKGLLRFNGCLRYMGGEPVLMPNFEKITDLFVENNIPEIYLPTSGIKFSPAIERACEKIDKCEIFISIDSGSPKTYEKIKGINAYNIVLNSLKKYAKKERNKKHLISKYIIIPKYNDNTTEIDKWIKDSNINGITTLSPDIEFSCIEKKENEKYYKHLLNLLKYGFREIKKAELNLDECVVYRRNILAWAEQNKEKLENDFPSETKILDITNLTKEDIINILEEIIKENGIWNKPEIKIVSQKETTENSDFEEILYECFSRGFNTVVNTNGEQKSEMIAEALKIANIKLFVDKNGKTFDFYKTSLEAKLSETSANCNISQAM